MMTADGVDDGVAAPASVEAGLDRAATLLADADKVLLTCHRGPDGDSVGSMVALAALLRGQGKEATLYSPDLVPRRLKWMPLVKTLVHRLNPKTRYDATVVVDCGDPKLLGDEFPPPEVSGAVIALDHHAAGVPFGDVFVCDPGAASVGVLVARLADRLGWPLDGAAAVGIHVSLLSDTGSFRYGNTNAEAFALAARLVEAGLDVGHVNERIGEQVPLSRFRLLSAALASLELRLARKVSFMTITHEMVRATKSSWEDSEGLVNYTRAIRGVECGVLFTPAKHGGVRVSMRSKGHIVDAGAVCQLLGGGGHRGAAGCAVEGEMDVVKARVEVLLAQALGAEPSAESVALAKGVSEG